MSEDKRVPQVSAFVRQIQVRMSALGMSRADLARALNVSRPVVTRLLSGTTNLELGTMTKLATAVGLETHISLRKKAGATATGCACCTTATTVAELIKRHGTLEDFERKVHAAVPEWISVGEAEAAAERYRVALGSAPKDDADELVAARKGGAP